VTVARCSAKTPAYTTGPEDAEVVLVSRSPGRKDVEKGKPFSGMSGVVVDHLLEEKRLTSVKTDKTTNIVLCETGRPAEKRLSSVVSRGSTLTSLTLRPSSQQAQNRQER
jgi:uracil-DNA glycosylase family 4